jgi:large subunit ribosomal protein L17
VRHGRKIRKLGRTKSHRDAMFKNLARSLVVYEHIRTTFHKAKEVQPVVERLIRFGRLGTVAARREVRRTLGDPGLVKKLFDVIAPRFADRQGGWTRVYRLGPRESDGAEMAVLELVVREKTKKEKEVQAKAGAKKEKKPAKPKKAERASKK